LADAFVRQRTDAWAHSSDTFDQLGSACSCVCRRRKKIMFSKCLPVILWVLAWQVSLPISSFPVSAFTSITLIVPAAAPPAHQPVHPAAVDDYRMDIQDGVTVDSYNLVPLAEHDAARTQSMIDGIAGRPSTPHTSTVDTDWINGRAAGWLPRPATAALWLAGLMAVVLVGLRLRR
jgi:hypothetical protein